MKSHRTIRKAVPVARFLARPLKGVVQSQAREEVAQRMQAPDFFDLEDHFSKLDGLGNLLAGLTSARQLDGSLADDPALSIHRSHSAVWPAVVFSVTKPSRWTVQSGGRSMPVALA